MFEFNRKKFFDLYKEQFGISTLTSSQVEGLEFLLSKMEGDARWKDLRCIAYTLATVYHETARSFQPVEEGYYLGKKAAAFRRTLRYYPYYGRGYVQLTWEANYLKAQKALGVNFVKKPDLVMVPEHSYEIMTRGMIEGWFTGKKLSNYFTQTKTDFIGARKIINGTDQAKMIASYASRFVEILTAALPEIDSPVPDSSVQLPASKHNPDGEGEPAQVKEDSTGVTPDPALESSTPSPGASLEAAANTATKWLDKAGDIQAGVGKVPFLSQLFTKVLAIGSFIYAFVQGNWELVLIAGVLFLIAAWYLAVVRKKAINS